MRNALLRAQQLQYSRALIRDSICPLGSSLRHAILQLQSQANASHDHSLGAGNSPRSHGQPHLTPRCIHAGLTYDWRSRVVLRVPADLLGQLFVFRKPRLRLRRLGAPLGRVWRIAPKPGLLGDKPSLVATRSSCPFVFALFSFSTVSSAAVLRLHTLVDSSNY